MTPILRPTPTREKGGLIALMLCVLLSGCATLSPFSQHHKPDGPPRGFVPPLAFIKNAVPKKEPLSRSGNPKSYMIRGKKHTVLESSHNYQAVGLASWYGTKFHGRKTSNGEKYDMHAMTAAHRTLPIPTYVEVENLQNGRKIIVRINDRGPFPRGPDAQKRIIDLSYSAARKLGMHGHGTAPVRIKALGPIQTLHASK